VPERAPVHVLYIEDDPGIARLVQRTLEQKGYIVEHAANGDEGVERLHKAGIDIVALDHHMPGKTGLEILPDIRAIPGCPPVIYVTGSEDSRIAVAALKAGAVDYVWKDVEGHFRELLLEAIATALEKERLRRAKERAEEEVREARDRAELMLREVNHRVANSLALVAAFTRMQANSVEDRSARDALQEIQGRIAAIAGIHRRLYTSNDIRFVEIKEYLTSLVEELHTTMQAAGRVHAIYLDAASIRLTTDKAVSLGVIVTELVTNSYKYAYPEGTPGDIRIKIAKNGADSVLLTVEDDGVGLNASSGPRGTGIGTKVIQAMAASLQSAVTTDRAHNGTRVTLAFPLS
jgi:two-component sensor histidine kinase/CheY-like chemotaxis protein